MAFEDGNRFGPTTNKAINTLDWCAIGHVFIYILLASCPYTTECIRMIRMNAESDSTRMEALLGSNLTLHCPYVLEGNDQLYSIKWHKKLNGTYFEFYSYISSPQETIHHKTLPGVRVDLSQSKTGEMVRIFNIDLLSEGTFRCEAISDETFQVVRQEMDLNVFIPAQKAPIIVGPRRTYGIGERVQLTCSTSASRPAARIKWFINDIPVPESYVRDNDDRTKQNQAEQSCTGKPDWHRFANRRLERSPSGESSKSTEQTMPTTSQLDFTLRREHLTETNHFVVRCMSFMDAQFYPEVRNSAVDISAWSSTTPVIVGLMEEYQLGDWVSVNCTVPAFLQGQATTESQASKIEWHINRQRVNRKSVVNYFTFGHIGLHFRLESRHLTEDLSLIIECRTLQMWPAERMTQYNTTLTENFDDPEEPTRKTTRFRPSTKGRPLNKTRQRTTKPTTVVTSPQTTTKVSSSQTTLVETETTKVLNQETTATITTTTTTIIEPELTNSTINGTNSIIVSIRQFTENHPQVITSLRLTLIPIALVGAFFLLG